MVHLVADQALRTPFPFPGVWFRGRGTNPTSKAIAAKIQGKLEAEAARKRDVKAAEKETKRQTRAAAKMQ